MTEAEIRREVNLAHQRIIEREANPLRKQALYLRWQTAILASDCQDLLERVVRKASR